MRRWGGGVARLHVICGITVLGGVTTNLVVDNGKVNLIAAGVALASTIVVALLGRRQPTALVTTADLLATAAELNAEVRRQWQREANRLGLATPDAIRLPLVYETGQFVAPSSQIKGRSKASLPRPRDVTHIGELYHALPSGRLIVLGEPEAGKSAALTMLASCQDEGGRSLVPFALTRWDPFGQTLDEWLAEDLAGQYPDLVQPQSARLLVERGHVVPLLDGLDEMPSANRTKAIEALGQDVWDRPFVLTSARDVYTEVVAAAGAPIPRAAVMTLGAVTGALAGAYLTAGRFTDAARWKSVAPLLKTPLMVYLARKVYDVPGGDPRDLLRLDGRRAVEEHLLRSYLAAAYRNDGPRPGWLHGQYTATKANSWLGYLARHLHRTGTTDVAWWRLETVTAVGVRAWTAVAAFAATAGVLPVLLLGDLLGTVGSLLVLCVGGLLGAAAGLQTMNLRSGEPYGTPPGHRLRDLGGTARSWGMGLYMLLAIGLGIAIVTTIGKPTPLTEPQQRPLALYPLLAVLMGGWVFGLDAVQDRLRRPISGRGSRTGVARLLAADRRVTVADALVVTAMTGVLIGALATGLADTAPGDPPVGPAFVRGFLVGVGYGLTYALFGRAWGRWLIYARLPLLLGRRQPARMLAFWQDAHRRGVLRQTGAVYQFRHAHLLDHLAQHR
ncbi:hypothetical protein ACN265_19185 [Micromonospora sp. WMMD730]|uniref:hypothetical protein n=1 Tax=Micromonospora sp. WMMD730 TaxID=3404128 RepID=UPI003B92F790